MQAIGKYIGLIVGLVFGGVWIFGSFGEAVLILVAGFIGYYAGAILTGEIDLLQVLTRARDRS